MRLFRRIFRDFMYPFWTGWVEWEVGGVGWVRSWRGLEFVLVNWAVWVVRSRELLGEENLMFLGWLSRFRFIKFDFVKFSQTSYFSATTYPTLSNIFIFLVTNKFTITFMEIRY